MRIRHWCWAILVAAALPAAAREGGNLAQYPPEELELVITTGEGGAPHLSTDAFALVTGRYYRLNLHCPDVVGGDLRGWRVEMPGLLRNAHLRLVAVGDVEVHLQGLTFHAIECDEVGSARVSFVPIRPGTYELYVGNVPLAVGRPMGEAGIQAEGQSAFARFVVE